VPPDVIAERKLQWRARYLTKSYIYIYIYSPKSVCDCIYRERAVGLNFFRVLILVSGIGMIALIAFANYGIWVMILCSIYGRRLRAIPSSPRNCSGQV
jgi:hypothetical protein